MERSNRSGAKMSVKNVDETTPLTAGKSEAVATVKVKATPCSRMQAPLQCFLRPAMWIPGLNRLHSHREVWKSQDSTPQKNVESIQRALMKVTEADKSHSDFIVSKAESDFLQIYVFTRAEWLDVIEMLFEGNEIKAFFWVPFLDMGMNVKRLKWILSHLDVPMERCSA